MTNNSGMNSMQRVLTTLGFNEPDRVPFALFLSLHGAKELGLSLKEFFSKAEYVFEAQMILKEKFKDDLISNFYYGAADFEAFGGEVIFREDGPPNSGMPIINCAREIRDLEIPSLDDSGIIQRVLRSTELLKKEVQDTIPIIGVVISPFSLPVMQMGFENYIELLYKDELHFRKLMEVNSQFCVEWSNAQLEAGATAICYFDPLSSPSMIPRDLYQKTGYEIAKDIISQINGPVANHLASGNCLPIADLVSDSGAPILGVSSKEDLEELKSTFDKKVTILGNLNGIEMARWTANEAREYVKKAIKTAGAGGGFILSDNHGEIPWQVSDEVLFAISETVHEFGAYPLSE